MVCFIVVSVHAYLLFSNLIKLSFRSRHLLIHESFTTREVSFEYNAQEQGYALTLFFNLEESGTDISHEVGLAALAFTAILTSLVLPSTTAQHQHT